MFEKILVCLDGSSLAEQVVPYATEQALHFKSKVVLLRVISMPGAVVAAPSVIAPGAYIPTAPENVQDVEDEARIYLENVADSMRQKGLEVECVTGEGSPASFITRYAVNNEIELVAISTRGHSGLVRTVLGSVADEIIRESGLPTLVIRPQEESS